MHQNQGWDHGNGWLQWSSCNWESRLADHLHIVYNSLSCVESVSVILKIISHFMCNYMYYGTSLATINFVHVYLVCKSSDTENPTHVLSMPFLRLPHILAPWQCSLVHVHVPADPHKFMWLSTWQAIIYVCNHTLKKQMLLSYLAPSTPTQNSNFHILATLVKETK